jgi:hypothetical protein
MSMGVADSRRRILKRNIRAARRLDEIGRDDIVPKRDRQPRGVLLRIRQGAEPRPFAARLSGF